MVAMVSAGGDERSSLGHCGKRLLFTNVSPIDVFLSHLAGSPNRYKAHAEGALSLRARRARPDGACLNSKLLAGDALVATEVDPHAATTANGAAAFSLQTPKGAKPDTSSVTLAKALALIVCTSQSTCTDRKAGDEVPHSLSASSSSSDDASENEADAYSDLKVSNTARLYGELEKRNRINTRARSSRDDLETRIENGIPPMVPVTLPQQVGLAGPCHVEVQEMLLPQGDMRSFGSRTCCWSEDDDIVLPLWSRQSTADITAADSQAHLRFIAGAHSLPHPGKSNSGGADSYFIDPDGEAFGVADGVGEWERRFDINARAFADELMSGCLGNIVTTRPAAEQSRPPGDRGRSVGALEFGYAASKSFGSSTALVAILSAEHRVIEVANLGDSALLVLRRSKILSPLNVGPRFCIKRTKEQQHSFNCPFQLARLPTPDQFPKLLDEGKEKLVEAVQQAVNKRLDQASDADSYEIPVQEGDLVVAGTDGVFDNLFVEEICNLADNAISPIEAFFKTAFDSSEDAPNGGTRAQTSASFSDPAALAKAITLAAFQRSSDCTARTPFSENARNAGFYHTGGKMDDITVVCAWVTILDDTGFPRQ